MFRKILSVIFAIFMFLPNAHSAEMVNVEYIHQYLNARWGIDLPYGPELTNPRVAANMKYLLTVVDIANEYLNGDKTTDYGNSEYATLAAADTVATNTAIDTLVKAPPFTITTTPNTSSFSMMIGAAGNFTIDWGDGQSEVITDKLIGATTYSHTYTTSGEYEIKLTGRATDYSDAKIDMETGANWVPAFALNDLISGSFMATNVAKISGGLGRVFPTMDDGSNPNFIYTFAMAPITEIPADLFDGISGAPTHAMFFGTFLNTAITSIPADLFGTLNGDGAPMMFAQTFSECPNLTTVGGPLFSGTLTPAAMMFNGTFQHTAITEIPADLFAGVQGAPAEGMFAGTFGGTAITEIPAYLFGELNGNGAMGMFSGTFSDCANLTTVGGPLFSGTLTPAEGMFASMFSGSGITSIPENMFGELTGDGAPSMFDGTFYYCANLTTVGGPLFSGTLTPAESMFANMFSGSGITSIPENIFGNLTGDGAKQMFYMTFYSCNDLTTVDGPLFSGTLTPAEQMFNGMFSGSGITRVPENIFGNLTGDGALRMFNSTFYNCNDLTTVEGPLFSGTLTLAEYMFFQTFSNSGITSVPENIFGNLTGDGAPSMFDQTFYDCANLTTVGGPLFSGTLTPAENMFANTFDGAAITEIPADLFAGIQGAPASYMFKDTFYNTNITEIPDGLFAGIQGAPARSMFEGTFRSCDQLQSIPADLFAGISGPAASGMFSRTFSSCTSLTGPSARINGQYLYEIWPNVSNMYTYIGSTGLSDYAQIPSNWK